MNVAICFNRVPSRLLRGEAADRLSEEGAEIEALAVHRALEQLGYRPVMLPLGEELASFIAALQRIAPDVVFNLCEGFWGDSRKEMHVAALFELLGIPFTGASPLALGLTQDKVRTKELLLHHRLPTPRYFLANPGEPVALPGDLAYPLFVKPRAEDASLGVTAASVVVTAEELRQRIDYIHRTYRQGALVEEYIEGREINAAVLGNAPGEALPLSEIRFSPYLPRAIVSYEGKWQEGSGEYAGTEPVCPAPLLPEEESLLREVARRACQQLDCRDYARVDIRLRDGIPYILEINANPDISPDAGLARAAGVAGIAYPHLIDRILQMALQRKEAPHARS
ncbi:MAG: ATP-grasp domain-containing protein [Desulfuromonadales bacterium]|nr:ATP-grasp domain-containing protein [Desulfuromonadales bacterium]